MNSTQLRTPTILFTGGGSSGHVTPNLALIKQFQAKNWVVAYAGSENGIEKEIIKKTNIPYYAITTDKLRRHFTWRNLLTPFNVIRGIIEATFLCYHLKPQIVFSKGGFVAFPIVLGAWLNRIPVIAHESDLTPGLANRLSFPFAKRICVTFPEGVKFFKNQSKLVVTGTPIRANLLQGNAEKGRRLCGFQNNKPVLLIIGGGLGSDIVNHAIWQILPKLLENFQVVHLCGKNKTNSGFDHLSGYKQYDYLNEELADVLAGADLVVSRAGANSIYELLALKKPHILIPLSTKASRGDQISNAKYFVNLKLSEIIYEEDLSDNKLLSEISRLHEQKEIIHQRLAAFALPDSVKIISELLQEIDKKKNS